MYDGNDRTDGDGTVEQKKPRSTPEKLEESKEQKKMKRERE